MNYELRINYKQLKSIVEFGNRYKNEEVVAVLLGHRYNKYSAILGFYEKIENISRKNKKWDYVVHPEQFLNVLMKTTLYDNNSKLDFLGIYHTHPYNRPIPSSMDIEGAGYEGFYLIYSPLFNDIASYYNEGANDDTTGAYFNNIKGFGPANLIIR